MRINPTAIKAFTIEHLDMLPNQAFYKIRGLTILHQLKPSNTIVYLWYMGLFSQGKRAVLVNNV